MQISEAYGSIMQIRPHPHGLDAVPHRPSPPTHSNSNKYLILAYLFIYLLTSGLIIYLPTFIYLFTYFLLTYFWLPIY